ncbi:uncharacterized protein HD556DRAFT_401273 [Suillus plorans]|uniref:Uncharacterized protein n=1 Tax=Suillus plorans TaxID=116603 RepID=A0A9P7AR71_9AGAM|nr:uncharacterized protein HD556DRAFT_401273 [Suillus plorans]KAG1794772.1 hypothetical protein HD556DRAFT_401273 [Suillus plorans]
MHEALTRLVLRTTAPLKKEQIKQTYALNFIMTLSLPLTILLLLHITFVCASLPSLNDTSIRTLDISDPSSCSNTRSLWDIIRSCAATFLPCTWTAIHPNIPGMDEGEAIVISRRLGIMVIALIAPELMIT